MRGSVSMSKGHHGQRYDEHFKKMIVELVESNQKSVSEIHREYDLTPSSLPNWVKRYSKSGSFKTSDKLTEEQKELIELRVSVN